MHWREETAERLISPGSQQRVDELLWIKVLQILDALADTNKFYRYPELFVDGKHDAAFGRAVQLRKRDSGNADCLVEHFRLNKCILTCVSVEDEEGFVGGAW